MTIGIGHNMAGDRLRSYMERVENIQGEIDAGNADKREIFAEAKGDGFNVKALKKLIQERRMDPQDREEQYELLDLYREAVKNSGRPPAPASASIAEAAPAVGVIADGPSSDDEPTATPPESRVPSGGEPTTNREDDDAEKEPMPERPSNEEAPATAAENEPESQETPVADIWTCTGCGWVGMAAMVTDECPECGASAQEDEPGPLDDGMPDFLNRKGKPSG